MADPAADLEAACDAAVKAPELQPTRDKKGNITATHCNQAVRRISQALGYHDFDDLSLTADAEIALMAGSPDWRKVDGATACVAALSGMLAVACMSSKRLGEAHGHVAVVYPVARQRSESLAKDVPLVANVGVKCQVMRSSQAFPVAQGEADYFVRNA